VTGTLAAAALSLSLVWRAVGPGVWQNESPMASKGPLTAVRAIAVRIDPSAHRFRLDLSRSDYGMRPAWTVDSMPAHAVLAVNAGQFLGGFPWGWLVRDGIEAQPPGSGTLAMSFVVDSSGIAALIMPDEMATYRRKRLRAAFQSYPALLVDGKIPWELRAPNRGVNLKHRDSRLAICTLADGGVVIVLTRVRVPGDTGATLPWGPTVPEMAQFMSSLGCWRAMLLDGGLSSQMALRDGAGSLSRWTNWRAVPLGLVVVRRTAAGAN
jgi:hypothetical protein